MNRMKRCISFIFAALLASSCFSLYGSFAEKVGLRGGEAVAPAFQSSFESVDDPSENVYLDGSGVYKLNFIESEEPEEPEQPASTGAEVDLSSISATPHYSNHVPTYLFDGKSSTKYLVMDSSTATVSFKTKSAVVLTSYALTSGNDRSQRDPKDWDLYGSANGSDWTLLDSRRSEVFANRLETNTYAVSNDLSYLWFKLDVLSNNGVDDLGMNIVQIAELTLNVPTGEETETGFTVVKSSIDGSTALSGEGRENLFDRDPQTKVVVKAATMWVSFRIAEPETVTAYRMVSANDWRERDPKSWTVYGSDDGIEWTAIDTRSDQAFSERYQSVLYRLDESVCYDFYKLEVTEKYGVNDYVQLADFTLLTDSEVPEYEEGMEALEDGAYAWSGERSLFVSGVQIAKEGAFARTVIYGGLSIPVCVGDVFSYMIRPTSVSDAYDGDCTSCRVMIDLLFTDGTTLSELNLKDAGGSLMTPEGQAEGKSLVTGRWNRVSCSLDAAAGKTVCRIDAYFEKGQSVESCPFTAYFDDLTIGKIAGGTYEDLSDYVDIRRGTCNEEDLPGGSCIPAVTMPNGFNLYVPVTDPSDSAQPYSYHTDGKKEKLNSISVMHAASGQPSYGTWQFMPNTSLDTSASSPTSSMISNDARGAAFSHENEIAHAHYYSVTLDEGTPASGVKIEIAPTSHAAYVRFTFPADAQNVNVIFDSLWGTGKMTFNTASKQSFTAYTNHNSAGSTRMYICGEFDRQFTFSKAIATKKGVVSFPAGTTVLTMKIASSFLSFEQAQRNLDLEIGDLTFDGVLYAARSAWEDLFGRVEIEGGTPAQKVDFYSCFYRMYASPNLYSENEGSNEEPSWVYSSPYSGTKTSGVLYTNADLKESGALFAAYSLFTPEKAGEVLGGLTTHISEAGVLPEVVCPGAVGGDSLYASVPVLADAYLKGIDFGFESIYETVLANALTIPSEEDRAPYLGYFPNDGEGSFTRSLESLLADYALYMAALNQGEGNEPESEYLLDRSLRYALLFSPSARFFMGRSATGVFSAGSGDFDPTLMGGAKNDYLSSNGWNSVFPALYDGEGTASLYGGREELGEKLDQLFTQTGGNDPLTVREAKMGHYAHEIASARSLIYAYAFSDRPWRTQEFGREILNRLYAGAEIGQGYIGSDSFAGQSAWFVFNALGFYPFCPASGEYILSSPLFERTTVHLENGNDLVLSSDNNSGENVYVQSASVNGQAYDKLVLTHETLTSGCTVEFEMGASPSAFGVSDGSRPFSVSPAGGRTAASADLSDGSFITKSVFDGRRVLTSAQIFTDLSSPEALFDGKGTTGVEIPDGSQIVLTGSTPKRVDFITLTAPDAEAAPANVRIEASDNGSVWKRLLEKEISFAENGSILIVPIAGEVRGSYRTYRLVFENGGTLSEIEFRGSVGEVFENPLGNFIYGDVDSDGSVNISDVTALLNFLTLSEQDAQQLYDSGAYLFEANDLNVDGILNILDVTTLLVHLSVSRDPVDPSAPFVPEPFVPSAAYGGVDENLTLTWNYADPEGESMEGSVTVSLLDSSSGGVYTVRYADDGGALEGVSPLGSVNVSSVGAVYTVFTASEKCAPALGAKAIVLLDQSGEIAAYEEIPAVKRGRGGALLGSFAAISDVHVFENSVYNGSYDSINGDEDLQRAVEVINAENVDFTAITGDLILSFSDSQTQINAELAKSTGILSGLEAPCFVVKGNHDKKVDEAVWRELTGCDLDYAFTFGGARFVFLSLLTVQNVGSVDDAPYGEAKLDWLEGELTANADKRVLLFMHYPVSGYAGLIPGNSYGFSSGSAEQARLLEILAAHGNVTTFNGHTHFNFASADTYPDMSVSRIAQTHSYFVHLPSVAYPRNASNVTVTEQSEGYIVRVLANGLQLEGMDFVTGEYNPAAIYFLDTNSANNALKKDLLRLETGESAGIETVNPYESASFRSSDESVATVSQDGSVYAVAPGSATIYCRIDGVTFKLTVVVLDENSVMRGSGTREDPYILTTAGHFVYIQNEFRAGRDLSGVYFAMGNDICLNDSPDFRPALSTEEGTFAGYFDGRGHILSATTAESSADFAIPYFYHVTGTIVNTVFECSMGGCAKTSYVVARTMSGGKMVNCIVRGSVYANNVNTSIVCGTSSGTFIANCFIDVSVSGTAPGSSESGVTTKGSGTVINVLYTPNGCKAQFGETPTNDPSTVAAAMNASLASSAASAGLTASDLCSWQNDGEGQPAFAVG